MIYTTKMTGNEPVTINECLCYLINCRAAKRKLLRASIIYGSGRSQVRVGDDLEIADLKTHKLRKKRWWERSNSNQLKLPFSLFSFAKILGVECSPSGSSFKLQISYKCSNNIERKVLTRFCYADWSRDTLLGIKAIRIHELAVNQSEDRILRNRRAPIDLGVDSCLQMANRAACAGLIVTRRGEIYNKVTGERVGYDLTTEPEQQPILLENAWFSPPSVLLGNFRLLSGELHYFRISSVGYINTDEYIPESRPVDSEAPRR